MNITLNEYSVNLIKELIEDLCNIKLDQYEIDSISHAIFLDDRISNRFFNEKDRKNFINLIKFLKGPLHILGILKKIEKIDNHIIVFISFDGFSPVLSEIRIKSNKKISNRDIPGTFIVEGIYKG